MLTSTELLNQGPLGNIWLAANYDKKLTKQQLLGTDIVQSTEYIRDHQISGPPKIISSSSQSRVNEPEGKDSITLRLSGQLLLGIVKIYSRKTKYLLDDVHDILYKLKASFRLSSGVQLGSDFASNRINVPAQQTTLADLDSITLKDQISAFDLFFQEDLVLDEPGANTNLTSVFNDLNQESNGDSLMMDFDQSIEYGRNTRGNHNIANNANDDNVSHHSLNDMDLDFDLNFDEIEDDRSIEQGRNASFLGDETETSFMAELNKSRNIFELDAGQPILSMDNLLEEDLNARHGEGNAPNSALLPSMNQSSVGEQQQQQQQQPAPRQRQRQKRTRITDEGELIVPNRKLVVDSEESMQGVPMQVLQENQENLMDGFGKEKYITLKLSESEKLKLVQELAQPVFAKRRKLWNLDTELQLTCAALARREQERKEGDSGDEGENSDEDDTSSLMGADTSSDLSLDLDLSIDVDSSDESATDEENDNEEDDEDEEVDEKVKGKSAEHEFSKTAKSTRQVVNELQDQFRKSNNDIVTFQSLMEADSKAMHPLGAKKKNTINPRREAAKCFFEMLALATNDCISIQQEREDLELGKNVRILPRDNLYTLFE